MVRLLLEELRFRRGGILGWAIGLCLFPIVYVGLFPTFADQLTSFQDILDLAVYKALGFSMGTFEEYMASTVTNMVPLILAIYAVVNGTGTLAGEEDDGRLELIAALPIPRWQIVAVKALALGIALFTILAAVSASAALTLMAISADVDTVVAPMDVFVSLLASWPLVAVFGMISLLLGAFSPNRRIASALAMVVVVVSYLGNNLAGMITSLEPFQKFMVFYYYDATAKGLVEGQSLGDLGVLLAVLVVAFLLAVVCFQRRDLTVGAWPWQRGKLPEGERVRA